MNDIQTFEGLGLSDETMRALKDAGYEKPTPIQAQAIPNILMARDLVGLAQTGTGKTASFTLPMIDILSTGRARARMPRSLVLAPTRELAAQVAENFDKYGKYHNLTKALLVGGSAMGEQMKLLDQGVDVLIATPGRLLDLFDRGSMILSDMKILVIDEADRMLDMGFIPDIEKIVSKLPPLRQTLLFSATMPNEVKRLTEKFLSNPRTVSVAPPATASATITQNLTWVTPKDKKRVLAHLLQKEKVANAFIFCNRKRDISSLCEFLKKEGFSAEAMHGDLAQTQRTETLAKFKNNELSLLVCSDVAARGLDVQGVSHVFNYDIPMHADDYVHRIGRTGRAGMTGVSWSLAVKDDEKYIRAIEKVTKSELPVVEVNDLPGTKAKAGTARTSRPDRPERKEAPARHEKPKRESENNNRSRGRNNRNASSGSNARPEQKVQPVRAPQTPRDEKGVNPYDHRTNHNANKNKRYQDDDLPDVVGFGEDLPTFMK
jgi:superfamily II DNA/RNA helicase